MKLVGDYIGFAVWFAGVGYIVLWPLADAGDGMPFGGSYICGADVLSVLCGFDHPLTLPPMLHLLGGLSAAVVAGQFVWRLLRRLHRRIAVGATPPGVRLAIKQTARRPVLRVLRRVQPRSEFGLRRPSH